MSANDPNVVSKFDFFLKKKKILKLWFSEVKNFPSKLKKFLTAKAEDIFLSDRSYCIALTPIKNHIYFLLTSSQSRRLLMGITNTIIMYRLENFDSVLHIKTSTESLFIFSWRLLKSEYFFGFFLKVMILNNTITTVCSLPSFIQTTVINLNSNEKTLQITFSTRSKMISFFYLFSIEIKIFDLLYYGLVYFHGRRILQSCFFAKTLREIDFMLIVIIIVIQISFTILDSINLNSSKK